ncbi:unnamed protein product [Bursaphelenchus okinawaensis]|uniref:Uncharacterized protein n=1 Tax=Bursaphelenchus okinawaensis TaxID=465554 RepID=A0A811KNZ1_9BILA|nr:unnamed protein product [Bursaphelenchus okinawaensis]CAG9106201.1 unnamed protein product [Bursaphelenchus okinawaensis]
MGYEFALTGHSISDTEALKRSKAKTVQEMLIFYLGATIYEFLTGSITVPYLEDMDEFYESSNFGIAFWTWGSNASNRSAFVTAIV